MTEEDRQAIEIALAHHEQQIGDLNEMITRQWAEIDRLKRLLEKTEGRLADIEAGAGEAGGKDLSVAEQAALDKPPHY